MVGGKALAEGAGVEFVHGRIGQIGQPLVAEVIRLPRLLQPGIHLGRFGVNGDLHLVHNGAKVGVEAGVQNLAKVFQIKAFVGGAVGNTNPGNIPLANVLDARSAVDEVMDLPFQHRLEIFLHLPPGHIDDNAQIHRPLVRDVAEVRPYHLNFAVGHFIHVGHAQILEAAGIFAAELHAHVIFAHHFPLKGGAIRHGHGHVGQLDLDAANFDALLHQPLGSLQVVYTLNFFPGHGDDVLVLGDAGGQNFRDDGVGNDREAEVDRPGGGGIFQVIYFAQGQHKGKDPFPVVEQNIARLTCLQAAKGKSGAGGEAQGIDGAEGVGAEGDSVGVIAQFDPFFVELVDDGTAVDVP